MVWDNSTKIFKNIFRSAGSDLSLSGDLSIVIGSVGSGHVDPADKTVEQPPPEQFYKDIREVMKDCNMSKNPKLLCS